MNRNVLTDTEKRELHLFSLTRMALDTVNILGIEQGERDNKELHFIRGDFRIIRGILKKSYDLLVFKGEDVVFDHPIREYLNEFNHTNYERGDWERELEQYSQTAKIIPQISRVLRFLGRSFSQDDKFFESFDSRELATEEPPFSIGGIFDEERRIKKLTVDDYTQNHGESVVFTYNFPDFPLHKRGEWESMLGKYDGIARKAADRREQDVRALERESSLGEFLRNYFTKI